MTFKDHNLCGAIIYALQEKGYTYAPSIETKIIHCILSGEDNAAAAAKTDIRKTAAFHILVLENVSQKKDVTTVHPQVLEILKFRGNHLDRKSVLGFGQSSQTRSALSCCAQEQRGQLANINHITNRQSTVLEYPFN